MGSFCFSTVPITDAIASTDSRLMEKRMDDSSSTALASVRRSVFSSMPAVLMLIAVDSIPLSFAPSAGTHYEKQKGQPWPPPMHADLLLSVLLYSVLSEAGDVIRYCRNLVIREALGNHGHLRAVVAGAGAEGGQLGSGIFLVLAGQARELHRDAVAGGAMAACACRHI